MRNGGDNTQIRGLKPIDCAIVGWLLLLALPTTSTAGFDFDYDLDSLVYLSDQIVRGRIDGDTLIVARSYLGDFRVGQRAALPGFSRSMFPDSDRGFFFLEFNPNSA